MENNLPIPYQSQYENKSYQVQFRDGKSKKRKIHGFIKFFALLMLCSLVIFTFFQNRDKISDFISRFYPNQNNQDTVHGRDGETNDKSATKADPLSHAVLSEDMSIGDDINETGEDLLFFEFDLKNSKEIYTKYGTEAPIVLIIHSNPERSYSDGKTYSENGNFYSENFNVSSIGEKLKEILEKNGIKCIHLCNSYSPSLYSSSEEYRNSISTALKKYPSISYVFDVSREIYINDDLTMKKGIVNIGENELAQIKFTVGKTDGKNAYFASKLREFTELNYPKLTCPTTYSRFSLSQEFCPCSLKIDIGSYGNSYVEAERSATAFAIAFANFVKEV